MAWHAHHDSYQTYATPLLDHFYFGSSFVPGSTKIWYETSEDLPGQSPRGHIPILTSFWSLSWVPRWVGGAPELSSEWILEGVSSQVHEGVFQ